MAELEDRSKFLVSILDKYVEKDDHILEIGFGDGRNLQHLRNAGYTRVEGIDKANGSAIEDVEPYQYDIIYTMSTLFLIPESNDWVFEKIAAMSKKWIFTLEGETTKGNGVIGRDYSKIFTKFGFEQVEHQTDVFNQYGVLRIFKRNGTS
jgi:hypothetical protein